MKKISAEIVADSICNGHRITTMLLTFPRFILPELLTHRMFSRNSASSRAIPFGKMVKMVEEDPFIPIAWMKDHKGMQGTEYFIDEEVRIDIGDEFEYREDIQLATDEFKIRWLEARDEAINIARGMNNLGLTKQLCNRLLEPFMWHTVLITFTEISNFFKLRCPSYRGLDGMDHNSRKDWWFYSKLYTGYSADKITEPDWNDINTSQAEIHIQALAEAMWDAYNESIPKQLKSGKWHLPFSDKINDGELAQVISPNEALIYSNISLQELRLKVCVSRCARLSYMTFDGKIDYEKDIKLHDQLLKNRHASPMEHCAIAKGDGLFYANFNSWQSYRNLLEL